MEKHFLKRILTVIVIFIVVFLLSYIFVESTLVEGARDRGILAFLFVFLVIIAVILGLIFDIISHSIGKIKEIKLMQAFLSYLFSFLFYLWLLLFLFIDGNE